MHTEVGLFQTSPFPYIVQYVQGSQHGLQYEHLNGNALSERLVELPFIVHNHKLLETFFQENGDDRSVANSVKSELNESMRSLATKNQASFTCMGIESLLNPREEENCIEDVDFYCLSSTIAIGRDTDTETEDLQNLEDGDNSEVTVKEALNSLEIASSVIEKHDILCIN